jgi:hypothetical protein
MGGVDARGLEELPNKLPAFGAVIIQALVGPLARDQHAAPGDAQVFESVGFALAAPRDMECRTPFGWTPYNSHTAQRGEHGVIWSSACSRWT